MIPPHISSAVEQYSAQLAEFLAAKFVDQALLQGFVTVLQAKFTAWIAADLAQFRAQFDVEGPAQVDSTTLALIELLQTMWAKFHHPIVKFYQRQHAELLALLAESFRNSAKALKSGQPKAKPQLRVVEMRKLNEAFTKLVTTASAFYEDEIVHIMKNYSNPLIPKGFLDDLALGASTGSAKSSVAALQMRLTQGLQDGLQQNLQPLLSTSSDFNSTLSYAVFYCLLNLGNLSRHAAQIDLTYVQPVKSVTAYYKNLKSGSADTSLANKLYLKPMRYYSKCIGILPTMHEPYNHMGVIHNALGEKFTAATWFLRSQFTRDTATTVGRYNIHALFTKQWLEHLYNDTVHKPQASLTASDVNNILMRIVADYFFTTAYRKPLYSCKVETDLLDILFTKPQTRHIAAISTLVTDHITMLICFLTLAEDEKKFDVAKRFGAFTFKYFQKYLSSVCVLPPDLINLESLLRNMRLIFAFIRKSDNVSQRIDNEFINTVAKLMNLIIDSDDEEVKMNALESFQNLEVPVRSHYFAEDVNFKDFTPIGCQFKDFNDSHLFASNNIDLLYGSYFYTLSGQIPSFLDNQAVLRINKELELGSTQNDFDRQRVIAGECSRYETLMRINAIVVMSKKLFGSRLSTDGDQIVAEKIEVPATQTPPKAKNTKTKTRDPKPDTPKPKKPSKKTKAKEQTPKIDVASKDPDVSEIRVSTPEKPDAPSTFKEIEAMIIGHAPKILVRKSGQASENTGGLAEMVDSIVSEEGYALDAKDEESQVIIASVEKKKTQMNEPANQVGAANPLGPTTNLQTNLQTTEPLHILHPPEPRMSYPAQHLESSAPVFAPSWSGYVPGQAPSGPQYAPMQMPLMPMSYYAPNFGMGMNPSSAQNPNVPPQMQPTMGSGPFGFPYVGGGGFLSSQPDPNYSSGGTVQQQYGMDQGRPWTESDRNYPGYGNMYPQYH
ncbi:hypothetical protein PUMCH_002333 [Australozyma saopauloensis]|uniref:Protein EBS1 n=1 Tax=Australozyma saopauloensis TaxID=291208 RepID=A0AAX4H9B0_9ASCO|nr:hypothetical protein PUMCH_002333 [[Candida] saopauloensis]